MLKIFISYSRSFSKKKRDIVPNLAKDLKELGHDVWFDQDLSGGQPWWDHICDKIEDFDLFLFVLEPNALKSLACTEERKYASLLNKRILPVLVSNGNQTNTLPPELLFIQYIDHRIWDRGSAIRLAGALNKLPSRKPPPDPPPIRPGVPVSNMKKLAWKVEALPSSLEEQMVLMGELRASLRNPKEHNDALLLLEILRNHDDLRMPILPEIEELLAHYSQAPQDDQNTALRPSPKPRDGSSEPTMGTPSAGTPVSKELLGPPVSPGSAAQTTTFRRRLLSSCIGAAIGAAYGVGAVATFVPNDVLNLRPVDWLIAAGISVSAGAFTGMITGTHGWRIAFALGGFILGFGSWSIAFFGGRFMSAALFGGPIGMFVGAIVGAVVVLIRRPK